MEEHKRLAQRRRHAERSWECPCGLVVRGNGGKSGHQRSCAAYAADRATTIRRLLAQDGWSPALREKLARELERFDSRS